MIKVSFLTSSFKFYINLGIPLLHSLNFLLFVTFAQCRVIHSGSRVAHYCGEYLHKKIVSQNCYGLLFSVFINNIFICVIFETEWKETNKTRLEPNV